MLVSQTCDLLCLAWSEVGEMENETKDWVSMRLTKEARQCLKIYAAQHNMNMSNALIRLVRQARTYKEGVEKNG